MVIDAWNAPDLDRAIDLLFYGITYENMTGKEDERYDVTNDKCLLYFNEIEETGISKSQILNGYYNALKHSKCGSKAKNNWKKNNYFNDSTGGGNGPRKKVEDNYQIIREFIETFEKDYKNYQPDKIEELNQARAKLFNYLLDTTRESDAAYEKIYQHWGKKIVTKINEIDVKISSLSNNLNSPLLDFIKKQLEIEIDNIETVDDKKKLMKNRMTDNDPQLMFEALEIMRKLVKVKADTKFDATKLTKLKKLKTDKVKGWEIINKYKLADGTGYADHRLKLYEEIKDRKTLKEKQIEFLQKIWDEDFIDEDSFKAKIDNANENDNGISDADKEEIKKNLTPRRKLAKELENKDAQTKQLIPLLKYFGKIDENELTQLENQLKSLEEYTKSGTNQNSVFNSLGQPNQEVVTNLIKEIQVKVAEIKKASEQNSSKPLGISGLTIFLITIAVIGLVVLMIYYLKRRKNNEEIE